MEDCGRNSSGQQQQRNMTVNVPAWIIVHLIAHLQLVRSSLTVPKRHQPMPSLTCLPTNVGSVCLAFHLILADARMMTYQSVRCNAKPFEQPSTDFATTTGQTFSCQVFAPNFPRTLDNLPTFCGSDTLISNILG